MWLPSFVILVLCLLSRVTAVSQESRKQQKQGGLEPTSRQGGEPAKTSDVTKKNGKAEEQLVTLCNVRSSSTALSLESSGKDLVKDVKFGSCANARLGEPKTSVTVHDMKGQRESVSLNIASVSLGSSKEEKDRGGDGHHRAFLVVVGEKKTSVRQFPSQSLVEGLAVVPVNDLEADAGALRGTLTYPGQKEEQGVSDTGSMALDFFSSSPQLLQRLPAKVEVEVGEHREEVILAARTAASSPSFKGTFLVVASQTGTRGSPVSLLSLPVPVGVDLTEDPTLEEAGTVAQRKDAKSREKETAVKGGGDGIHQLTALGQLGESGQQKKTQSKEKTETKGREAEDPVPEDSSAVSTPTSDRFNMTAYNENWHNEYGRFAVQEGANKTSEQSKGRVDSPFSSLVVFCTLAVFWVSGVY
uniref:Uncharacterized protein n=1 Tax=Chromera velia CCMP2878 TaxID=1169474 RepID=A0A0G4HUW6_9ALVE|mmetsp:Transcript_3749/g.7724  ORF Transcript_3749/g.7724 Transcript_3749/m.7724 type:complete len:415 (+) Transcript_3749:350-1594(+)|eukprot:Cvel_8748.t1-p1 / transcript=Cvel_8748.t1 / gene=Cvel_8748 / organism=Chromera_velia_CCMP2878 / gene_product=hypothetical protein / transcript_product=hypothetical protein / location=Cvel_scaffold489:39452-42861(+) / protein_length=414 / sequence_SO=supercontig / SO=protein_coding / is_pseudo=false